MIHPSIDACVQLREQGVTPDNLEKIELKVHPLVLELTGKTEPTDGLQGKFSVYHGCSVGLIYGRASEDEYADDVVNDPIVVATRRKVQAQIDESIHEASVVATATLTDGTQKQVVVEHAIGSLERAMSNADLEAKFSGMTNPILGEQQTRDLLDACWSLGDAADIKRVVQLSRVS